MSKKKNTFNSLLGGVISQKMLSPKEEKAKIEDQIKQNIIIFQELKALIPPLQKEEYLQLEKNILSDVKGIREPLKLWQTTVQQEQGEWIFSSEGEERYVLIDGHNRYSIAKEHHLDFPIEVLSFESLEKVKDWMIHFQLGRRNLTPEQAAYLRGLLYNQLKQQKGGNQYVIKRNSPKYQNDTLDKLAGENNENSPKYQNDTLDKLAGENNENSPKYQNDTLVETADKLADKYNVSKITIKRDGKFAEALNFIGKVNPQLKEDLLSGVQKAKKSDIQALLKADIGDLSLHSVDDIAKEASRLQLWEDTEYSLNKNAIIQRIATWYDGNINDSKKGKHVQATNLVIGEDKFDLVQFVQTKKVSYLFGINLITSSKKMDINPALSDYVDASIFCVLESLKEKFLEKNNQKNQKNVIFISEKNINFTNLITSTPVLEKKMQLMEALLTKLI